MCVPLCNVVHFVDSIHQESERRIEKDFDFHVSFVHTPEQPILVHRIWRTLAYVCMLHYALAYRKALHRHRLQSLWMLLCYHFIQRVQCAIYEWNIFAWRSGFPFIFCYFSLYLQLHLGMCMRLFFTPSTSPPHILSLCVFLHPIFKVRCFVYIVPAVYENIHVYKIDPLLDNNKLKTKSDRNST